MVAAAPVAVVRNVMAAVHSLRVSVKSDSGSERSNSASDSESDRDAREAEPMEVEEGELEADDVPVNRSLKELLPVRVRGRPCDTGDWSGPQPARAPAQTQGGVCRTSGLSSSVFWCKIQRIYGLVFIRTPGFTVVWVRLFLSPVADLVITQLHTIKMIPVILAHSQPKNRGPFHRHNNHRPTVYAVVW